MIIMQDSVRPTQFMRVLQRLKEEHAALKVKLTDLNTKAEQVHLNLNVLCALNLLQLLLTDVQILKKELDAHEEWEEQHVYPIASEYFKLQNRPSCKTSNWVLEKERELVKQCYQPFLDLLKLIIISIDNNDAKLFKQLELCATYLLQGCSLLREHIELEEGLIYPLVNEIITDIDYLYSCSC